MQSAISMWSQGIRMAIYESILYLDDQRVPKLRGVELVRSYAEFVQYLVDRGVPDLISFDHDLALEHYPLGPNKAGQKIPYASFKEKTGLDCARYVIENGLPLKHWAVHSQNVQGKINIERELRRSRSRGERRDLYIPFEISQPEETSPPPEVLTPPVLTPPARVFSATSLLQFQENLPLEGWERALMRTVARRTEDPNSFL